MTDTTTTVTFQSGATRELHPSLVDRIAGLSAEGRVVVDDGFGYLFGLTFCCNAYDKGMEHGSGCRACYSLDDAGQYFAEVADPIVRRVMLTPAALALLSDVLDTNDDDEELAENSGATIATITELRAAVAAALRSTTTEEA